MLLPSIVMKNSLTVVPYIFIPVAVTAFEIYQHYNLILLACPESHFMMFKKLLLKPC